MQRVMLAIAMSIALATFAWRNYAVMGASATIKYLVISGVFMSMGWLVSYYAMRGDQRGSHKHTQTLIGVLLVLAGVAALIQTSIVPQGVTILIPITSYPDEPLGEFLWWGTKNVVLLALVTSYEWVLQPPKN